MKTQKAPNGLTMFKAEGLQDKDLIGKTVGFTIMGERKLKNGKVLNILPIEAHYSDANSDWSKRHIEEDKQRGNYFIYEIEYVEKKETKTTTTKYIYDI